MTIALPPRYSHSAYWLWAAGEFYLPSSSRCRSWVWESRWHCFLSFRSMYLVFQLLTYNAKGRLWNDQYLVLFYGFPTEHGDVFLPISHGCYLELFLVILHFNPVVSKCLQDFIYSPRCRKHLIWKSTDGQSCGWADTRWSISAPQWSQCSSWSCFTSEIWNLRGDSTVLGPEVNDCQEKKCLILKEPILEIRNEIWLSLTLAVVTRLVLHDMQLEVLSTAEPY